MTFSVYIGSVYFLFIFFFVGWDQNLNVNILGEFSVKIGFSFFGQGDFWRCFGGLIKHHICFGCLMSKKGLFLMRFGNFSIFFGGGGGEGVTSNEIQMV